MQFNDFLKLVRSGDLDKVKSAVKTNPDLIYINDANRASDQERTAMHSAATYGHLDIIKFLVSEGAEVYSNPMNTYPPVFWAANNRHRKDAPNCEHIVDYFLNEIPDKAMGTNGLGIMINLAGRLGFKDIVEKHIQCDPLSVFQRGWIGDSPLHWPAHNGHLDIVKLLVDAGADIEADEINCYGGKPLHWAGEKQTHVVEYLLEKGAVVDSKNNLSDSTYFNITPLGMNVLMTDDCAEVTKLLIEAGADTSFTFKGQSLIQIAEENKNEKILEVLKSQ